ncbi:MAG: hypothetical protein DDT23_01095 [candidate division WS2 bacterium]|nr:hypothetical protein [Candidatus Lithacetigena glycinireducens]
MITPLRYSSGRLVRLPMAASSTVVKQDLLGFTGGFVRRATSLDTEVRFMAMEDRITGVGENPEILCLYLDGVECEGITAGTVAQTHVGTYIDLTNHNTLNEAASIRRIFFVTERISARRVGGYFVIKS